MFVLEASVNPDTDYFLFPQLFRDQITPQVQVGDNQV